VFTAVAVTQVEAGDLRRVTSENDADDIVATSNRVMVVVNFNARWCRPCAPLLERYREVAQAYGDTAEFWTLDIGEAPEVADMLGVQTIPAVMAIRNGKPVITGHRIGKPIDRLSGAASADELRRFLEQAEKTAAQ
jgi:thioredoxin-like negative regulator of GroEL